MTAWPVDPHLYGTFLGVMGVMAVTPGPANLFAVATGVQKGHRAALAGVVGMNAATLVWFGAAALGLGTLVLAFPDLFRLVAMAGVAYVAWLGLKAWRGAFSDQTPTEAVVISRRRSALIDGFLVQIANPKLVLFFTVVLPPFVDVSRPVVAQLILFAMATIGLDALAMAAYGLGGSGLTRRMNDPGFRRVYGLAVGLLLMTAAVLMALRI